LLINRRGQGDGPLFAALAGDRVIQTPKTLVAHVFQVTLTQGLCDDLGFILPRLKIAFILKHLIFCFFSGHD
jgi:hypothetical protein